MSENVIDALDAFGQRLTQGTGGNPPVPPDLVAYRLDKNEEAVTRLERRAEAIEASLGRIEAKFGTLATGDTIRNWNLAIIGIVVAAVLALGGLLLAASGNQLSAFQAGLSAVQTAVAVKPPKTE